MSSVHRGCEFAGALCGMQVLSAQARRRPTVVGDGGLHEGGVLGERDLVRVAHPALLLQPNQRALSLRPVL